MGIQWDITAGIYRFKKADNSDRRKVLYSILIQFDIPGTSNEH
jgi:hypothetical protein